MGPDWNSCNLGSLNLYNFVQNKFTDAAKFDFTSFSEAVGIAVETLDEILDYGYDLQPLEENRQNIHQWRSIGLGFFGLADALVALKLRYGSLESIYFINYMARMFLISAISKSTKLAENKGKFELCDNDKIIQSDILQNLNKHDLDKIDDLIEGISKYGMRNSQLMSIAPTGSLSLLAGNVSSGIEPIFRAVYERTSHGLEDQKISFTVADRAIEDLLEFNNIDKNSITSKEIKEKFPWVVEAEDISPMERLNVQAAIQKFCDNAISSTVNLPESATVEDIEKIYMSAWDKKLKGITVFRNNCKRMSILGTKKEEPKTIEVEKEIKMDSLLPIIPRSSIDKPIEGTTYLKHTACVKSLYVTVNHDENGNIFEVFTNKSTHGCAANIATITRMTSLALRMGGNVKKIIGELKENQCQACLSIIKSNPDSNLSRSCPYAIAEALESEYNKLANKTKEKTVAVDDNTINMMECPECHKKTLIPEGKCVSCKNCGYSKCD